MTAQEQIDELRRTVDDLKQKIQAMEVENISPQKLVVGSHDFPAQSPEPVYHPSIWTPDSEVKVPVYQSHQRLPSGDGEGAGQQFGFNNPNGGASPDYYLKASDRPYVRTTDSLAAPLVASTRYPKCLAFQAILFKAGESLSDVLVYGVKNSRRGLHARLTTIILPDQDPLVRSDWTEIFAVYDCNGNVITV